MNKIERSSEIFPKLNIQTFSFSNALKLFLTTILCVFFTNITTSQANMFNKFKKGFYFNFIVSAFYFIKVRLRLFLILMAVSLSFANTSNASSGIWYIWLWDEPTLVNNGNSKFIKSPYFINRIPEVGEVIDLRDFIPLRKFRSTNPPKEIETQFYSGLDVIMRISSHYNSLYYSKRGSGKHRCGLIRAAGSKRYYMGELGYGREGDDYCTIRYLKLKKYVDYFPRPYGYKVKVLSYVSFRQMTFMQIIPIKEKYTPIH